ncbi:hercynine metabolism small protein [Synechococcus sp. CC9616]|uniref:hercynine metabolism small protein n=1 Tax=Synechococcus sp. CC9616 TaxID=110663 RepID=UPI00048A50DD|nr:hercynine metabolism small protein [Synechococcus sp. CC9616]
MKQDERREAIRTQREQLIRELEALYLAAFDRLGQLEGDVGEVKAAQLTQMILNSKTGAIEPLLKEIEKPVITTPAGDTP